MLLLSQSLIGLAPPPALVLVTHGSQAVKPLGLPAKLAESAHAGVWGFARSLRLESAALSAMAIDVSGLESAVAAEVMSEVCRSRETGQCEEPQLAWEEGCASCPNHCSGNGECLDATCVCNTGFTGFDCDFPAANTTEAEACGEDTNGGCNSDPVAFESISEIGRASCRERV